MINENNNNIWDNKYGQASRQQISEFSECEMS